MSLPDDLMQQMQNQQQLQQALASRIPELLGVPMDENGILEVDGTEYKVLQSFEQSPGYMLAVEASTSESGVAHVVEPAVIYVPEIKQAIEDLSNNPVAFFQKITALADDETLPQDLRDQLGAIGQMFSMME